MFRSWTKRLKKYIGTITIGTRGLTGAIAGAIVKGTQLKQVGRWAWRNKGKIALGLAIGAGAVIGGPAIVGALGTMGKGIFSSGVLLKLAGKLKMPIEVLKKKIANKEISVDKLIEDYKKITEEAEPEKEVKAEIEKKKCFIASYTYTQTPIQFYIVKSYLPIKIQNLYYRIAPRLCKVPKIIFLPILEAVKTIN